MIDFNWILLRISETTFMNSELVEVSFVSWSVEAGVLKQGKLNLISTAYKSIVIIIQRQISPCLNPSA